MNSVVAVPDLLGTCPADLLPDGDVPQSTAEQARARAKRIVGGLAHYTRMRQDIADARACRDWIALGYSSWFEYVETEFGPALRKLSTDERRQAVQDLRAQGASTRQIAKATGVGQSTIRDDLKVSGVHSPETVIGRDGKTYAASRHSTPEPTFVLKYSASAGCWIVAPVGALPFASDDSGIDYLDVPAAQAWAAEQTAYVERREVIRWRESPDTDGAWIAVLSEDVPAGTVPAAASPAAGTTGPERPAPDSRPGSGDGAPAHDPRAGAPHNVPAGHNGGHPAPTPAPPPADRAAPTSPARGTEEVGKGSPTDHPRTVGEPAQHDVMPWARWADDAFDFTNLDPAAVAAGLDDEGWRYAAAARTAVTVWFERLFAHRA